MVTGYKVEVKDQLDTLVGYEAIKIANSSQREVGNIAFFGERKSNSTGVKRILQAAPPHSP